MSRNRARKAKGPTAVPAVNRDLRALADELDAYLAAVTEVAQALGATPEELQRLQSENARIVKSFRVGFAALESRLGAQ